MHNERTETAIDATQKLENLQEISPKPFDQRVLSFAKYLATKINNDWNKALSPEEFTMACTLAIYDLENGFDGFSGHELSTGLENLPRHVYDVMLLNIPDIAETVFPRPYAQAVKESFREVLDASGLKADEYILRPITTLEAAQDKVIDGAKIQVEHLDWEHFGTVDTMIDIIDEFDNVYPDLLRKAPADFPLRVLQGDTFNDAILLKATHPSVKKYIGEQLWLAMTTGEILPEDATLVRDWLYVKTPGLIAKKIGLDPVKVIGFFKKIDGTFTRAQERISSRFANRQY